MKNIKDHYTKTTKKLQKKIKELNKWTDIPASWMEDQIMCPYQLPQNSKLY